VENIQDLFFDLHNTALDALVDLFNDVNANKDKVNPEQLANARDYQRRGHFMIDFIMSENSTGLSRAAGSRPYPRRCYQPLPQRADRIAWRPATEPYPARTS